MDLREYCRDGQKIRYDANVTKLGGIFKNLKELDRRLILHAKHTGFWMTVRGTTIAGVVLVDTEFSDLLCAHYNITPNIL